MTTPTTIEELRAELERVNRACAEMRDAAEMLWVVLADVSEGDWKKQTQEWQDAAPRWRDELLEFIEAAKPGDTFPRKTPLSPTDQAWVRSQLDPFGHLFVYQITDKELLVIRDR